jgi:ABC-type multidrug transport system ATPase subunit
MEQDAKMPPSPNSSTLENSISHFASSRDKDESVNLVWKDLEYNILVKDAPNSTMFNTAYKTKRILQNCSGTAKSGELLAIMGPTGCGKTSLLNVLAARVANSSTANPLCQLSGAIYLNGKPRKEEKFRRISAYVLQDDNMYPHLTIAETLFLSAQFFLPSTISDEQKQALVDGLIKELGLSKGRNTTIGNEKVRGVSGGERKRCSIAVQLLSDPAVLFLDEPTSGLDSFQALAVMEAMKALSQNGRLVISVSMMCILLWR